MGGEIDEAVNRTMVRVSKKIEALELKHPYSVLSTESTEACIFKIPEVPLLQNEKVYVPIAFSIGPWHQNKPNLIQNDELKTFYLRDLINRSGSPMQTLNELTQVICDSRKEASKCYAGLAIVDYHSFLDTLLIDSCFIIEFLYKWSDKSYKNPHDPLLTHMLQFVYHDLLLLENQIPWFVLQQVFDKTRKNRKLLEENHPLAWYVDNLLEAIFPSGIKWRVEGGLFYERLQQRAKHILDFSRLKLVLPLEAEEVQRVSIFSVNLKRKGKDGWKPIPPATSLRKAGIKIKGNQHTDSILKVDFKKGVLRIPSLEFREGIEQVFRNLISFEQCMPKCPHKITSYVILMGCLINTTKDFELLCEAGIFDNWMNAEDVISFFNKPLYSGAYVREYHYLGLSKEVNKYCKRKWPRLRAIYRNEFTTPWAIISQIVAGILFILTLLQTVFTIKNK